MNCEHVPTLLNKSQEVVGLIRNVRVYEKCGPNNSCRKFATHVHPLPNVGSCDHTFAHDMGRHWNGDAKITVYAKDNFNHVPPRSVPIPRKVENMLRDAQKNGIGCVLKARDSPTHFRWSLPRRKYVRKTPHRNSSFDGVPFAPPMHLSSISKWWEELNLDVRAPFTTCYTGTFAVSATSLMRVKNDTFRKIETLLSRGDNIMESHYMERTWGIMMTLPSSDQTSSSSSPHLPARKPLQMA